MGKFRLTGGTLLTLIVNAIKKDSSREVSKNGYSNTTNPLVLEGLIGIADFSHIEDSSPNKSYTQLCSKYKNCKDVTSPTYLDFSNESQMVKNFRKSMNNHPSNCLRRAKDFTNKWINNKELACCLVNAILTLIQMDDSIDAEYKFYLDTDLSFKTKGELSNVRVTLSNLILSCWFYVHDRQVINPDGRDTILMWYKGDMHNKFAWDKWKEYGLPFDITPGKELVLEEETEIPDEPYDDSSSSEDDGTINIFEDESESEYSEAEVFTAEEKKSQPNVVFNNYGGTQNNVVNYGDITINVGGKKDGK